MTKYLIQHNSKRYTSYLMENELFSAKIKNAKQFDSLKEIKKVVNNLNLSNISIVPYRLY